MRSLSIAAILVPALLSAAPAVAQVYYQQGSGIPAPPMANGGVQRTGGPLYAGPPRHNQALPPRTSQTPPAYNNQRNGGRWGGHVNGRWWGGAQAPGGWNSYRRPSRGWSLPGYWMNSNFRIHDYGNWGLRAPSYGFYWVRYYDDAVLIDSRGRVQDWRDGISWDDDYAAYDNYGTSYGAGGSNSYAYSESNVSVGGIRQVDPNQYYDQAPGYQTQAPYPGGYASPAVGAPPAVQVQPGYGYGNGYGYSSGYSGGGYYAGGTTTTVVIQPAPVVTTTIIEEVIEEEVVTTYVAPRRVVRRAPVRKYKPKPRPAPRQCGCQCVCR
ncbi:RcnB family protein [Sphingomonas sp. G-3-2-10]|uniref:RcnB family protein n=1 Tax=Sphingomonas sp. G-3-2-10 TaxID=2728838 RepID=UPI00146AF952|nr:RcnB family protein [Sphingomonas sp. G-3-2-10]NML06453.1 RcnB family protein [Sphingomonas sp. G-3-2-10]